MTTKSTTQLDVEENEAEVVEEVLEETTLEEEDVKKEQRLKRNSMMDDLADRRKNQFDEEIRESEEDEEEDDELEEDTMIDLKVDGEVVQKLKSEVDSEGGVDAYQMKLAADKRFKDAAEKKKQLDQRERDLKEKEDRLSKRELEQRKQDEDDTKSDEELAVSLSEGFYSGNTEEIKEKILKILKIARSKDAPIDRDQIIKDAKFQIQRDEGISEFNKKYAHIRKDKMLFDLANKRTAEIMAGHPDLSPKEIILQAAKEVDEKFNPVVEVKETKKKDEMEEITERKKSIPKVKRASSRKPSEQTFKPETKDEIFSRYKRNRSQ